jgi:hypothetical protein
MRVVEELMQKMTLMFLPVLHTMSWLGQVVNQVKMAELLTSMTVRSLRRQAVEKVQLQQEVYPVPLLIPMDRLSGPEERVAKEEAHLQPVVVGEARHTQQQTDQTEVKVERVELRGVTQDQDMLMEVKVELPHPILLQGME